MAEIVNLRLVKKRKEKAAKEKTAAENRILFGRTKIEKEFARDANRKEARFLDDNRLEKSGPLPLTKPDTGNADET